MDDVILGKGKKLLLMGSKAYKDRELPKVVKQLINVAIKEQMLIIVGEASGACRLYQDHLHSQGYPDVIVGHARSLRYNAGNWPNIKYGDNLLERERKMIEDCDSAIIIWVNQSSQIAANLERLKWLGKPTFLYECSSYSNEEILGPLDPNRVYQPYLHQKLRAKYGKPPIRLLFSGIKRTSIPNLFSTPLTHALNNIVGWCLLGISLCPNITTSR